MNDIPPGISEAAPWSLLTGALGRGSVVAAIVLFAFAALAMLRPGKAERAGTAAFVLGCLSLFTAFGALALLFVKDQFQFAYVWQHSDTTTSLPYKVASVWTAQEGSFLLWACTSALFALLAVRGTGPYRRGFVGVSALFLGTIGAMLAFESPFEVMKQVVMHGKTLVPPTGNGMVPSLQNYWVIIHPPTIFLGFGSLSLMAAYAVAAMLHGDAQDWVARVRPWALTSVAILGLGISMGGLWAYETQGWGGFWAWDPVENVSFVPWLFMVALAHGLIVQAARKKWAGTNLFLGGVPFLTFVYGTFLTRSGLLDKVSNHSFATMDASARGILKLFLLVSLALFVGVFLWRGREAARQADAQAQPEPTGVSREGLYRSGMLLLSLLGVVIALGMSWPVVTALRGGQGSAVKEPLYHLVVTWFYLPLMAFMAIGPFTAWRGMEPRDLRERLFGVLCVSVGLTGMIHLFLLPSVHLTAGATVAAPFGMRAPLALWMLVLLFSVVLVVVANVWRVTELARRSALGTGGFVAHLGVAVLLGGLILSRGYERKEQIDVRDGRPASALGYTVTYKGVTSKDFFDRSRKVEFDVTAPDGSHFVARPGHYRYNPDDPKDQVWPHIEHFAGHDVYLSMLPPQILATAEPILMKPGQSVVVSKEGGVMLEYLESTNNGKFGTQDVEFGAKLRLTQTVDGERRQYLATPTVGITPEGLAPTSLPSFGPDLKVALVGGIDASDKSAHVALLFSPPIYQIELFDKPLTGLVWLGTGIMTFGGLLAAFSRRRVVARRPKTAPIPLNDATLPAAQG